MKRITAKSVWVLLVTLSMMSTAAAACLCDHHKPVEKAVESSCHFEVHHDTPDEKEIPDDGNRLQVHCDCIGALSVPAITTGQVSKKSVTPDEVPAVNDPIITEEVRSFSTDPGSRDAEIPSAIAGRDLDSGPSRAPPRL